MNTQTILSFIRTFLTVFGVVAVLWGVYDIFFGEGGAASSVGSKKIIGGIAFAAISFLIFSMAMNEIKKAEAEAGITSYIPPQTQIEYRIQPSEVKQV